MAEVDPEVVSALSKLKISQVLHWIIFNIHHALRYL